MIALTQEKREELIKECEFDIDRLTSLIAEFPEEIALQNVLLRQKIALTSLTAESVMVSEDFHDAALGIIDGRFHRCGRSVTLEKVGLYEQEKMHPVYLAPPVPEIKLPKLSDGYPVSEWTKWYIAEIKRLNGWG